MPFDVGKFEQAQLEPRRAKVRVEALAAFFSEGEEPEWEVRSLTATELYKAMETRTRQDSTVAIVNAIASNGDQVAAVRRALGLTKDVPGEIAKRMEMLTMASIAPVVELPTAVRLAEKFPIEFMLITNQITLITGMGADVVKPGAASQPTTVSQ